MEIIFLDFYMVCGSHLEFQITFLKSCPTLGGM